MRIPAPTGARLNDGIGPDRLRAGVVGGRRVEAGLMILHGVPPSKSQITPNDINSQTPNPASKAKPVAMAKRSPFLVRRFIIALRGEKVGVVAAELADDISAASCAG